MATKAKVTVSCRVSTRKTWGMGTGHSGVPKISAPHTPPPPEVPLAKSHLADEGLPDALVVPVRGGKVLVVIVGGWPVLMVGAVQGGCRERRGARMKGARSRGAACTAVLC